MADIRTDGVYYSRSDMVDGKPKAGAKPWRILAVDAGPNDLPVVASNTFGEVATFTKYGRFHSSGEESCCDLIEYVAPQHVPFDDLCDEWQFGWMVSTKEVGHWVLVPTTWSRDQIVVHHHEGIYNVKELFRDFLLSKDGGKTWQPCGKLKSPA